MYQRSALIQPGHFHRGPGGHDDDHVLIGCVNRFQRLHLTFGQGQGVSIQPFRFGDFIQADVHKHIIGFLRQFGSLAHHGRVGAAMAGISRSEAHHIQIVIPDHIHGVVQLGAVHHG